MHTFNANLFISGIKQANNVVVQNLDPKLETQYCHLLLKMKM